MTDGRYQVLFVGDRGAEEDALPQMLRSLGHTVRRIGDADQLAAIDLAQDSVIVLDWCSTGARTARAIAHQLQSLTQMIPWIVVVSSADLAHCAVVLKRYAVDFLLEPLQPEAFQASLRRAFLQHEMADRLRLLQTAISDLKEGVLITDARLERPGPKILFVNNAVTRITGYSAEELIGHTPRLLYGPATDRSELNRLKVELKSGRSYAGENVNYRKDGTEYYVQLQVSPVYGTAGRVTSYVCLHRDITECKLAEARALQAERLAAVGRAVTGLAHESRNALQRAHAALEMLERRVGDREDVRELVHRISEAQDDLTRLYEGVCEYAAPVRLNFGRLSLDVVVAEAWEHLAAQRQGREAVFREHGKSEDIVCEVDRFTMRQVFRNLLDNALAAANGSAEIDIVYAAADLAGRPSVSVSMCDCGCGLTPEARRRIFDEFYTSKTRGVGLGMPIAKKLVAAHGGEIRVGSGHGPGTEIIVTIPRRQT